MTYIIWLWPFRSTRPSLQPKFFFWKQVTAPTVSGPIRPSTATGDGGPPWLTDARFSNSWTVTTSARAFWPPCPTEPPICFAKGSPLRSFFDPGEVASSTKTTERQPAAPDTMVGDFFGFILLRAPSWLTVRQLALTRSSRPYSPSPARRTIAGIEGRFRRISERHWEGRLHGT